MSPFTRLIRFHSSEDGCSYFMDLGDAATPPDLGSRVVAYESLADLQESKNPKVSTISKLLAPLPYDNIPIYCVGLNYRSHAREAGINMPQNPPLWTKPTAALANPDEDVHMNSFCASGWPDYEGELVFVTSRVCRDITPEQAQDYILGYTAGNDLSCRLYQQRDRCGGQYFFAKAFDKFAPIGPVLISPKLFGNSDDIKLVTKVNGQIRQESSCVKEQEFSPTKVLSYMSQGTTIPAGTAVMTGTPAGVGLFRKPKEWLKDGDLVEVEISKIGVLRNKIVFS